MWTKIIKLIRHLSSRISTSKINMANPLKYHSSKSIIFLFIKLVRIFSAGNDARLNKAAVMQWI